MSHHPPYYLYIVVHSFLVPFDGVMGEVEDTCILQWKTCDNCVMRGSWSTLTNPICMSLVAVMQAMQCPSFERYTSFTTLDMYNKSVFLSCLFTLIIPFLQHVVSYHRMKEGKTASIEKFIVSTLGWDFVPYGTR